ncbi:MULTISPECIES: type 2 lanthipeptide synthetase LanM [Bacillus]|uniref:type 2 lanthipeptide synthetase LanM n=1 Tax=Bacillus TaxID=1386 RepID=UPI00077B115F|nr:MULTISPECIES: type 2 lanthipeptide synthetase LanM [Bacillus cereus group]KXY69489.1 lantibiotic biosynthesis protein [Bacillus cereus]MBG9936175.1 type 2 lantibiotic biosynthesis protein LanM [Bacillus tropicus]MED2992320.1 type 2 lanthipeptide synthetase LanM [Bacillus tropicus]OTY60188.1 type 2 lantipeptide synthetase LanM [Bacillus thuringiensis serovar graciosensis]
MLDLHKILFSFERNLKSSHLHSDELFKKNLKLLYQNDKNLAEQHLNDVLSIKSLSEFKDLYANYSSTSINRVQAFSTMQKKISRKKIKDIDTCTDFGSAFCRKIAVCFKDVIYESRRYKKMRHNIYNEHLFFEDLIIQYQEQVYKLLYRTLVFDFHVSKQKEILLGNSEAEKLIFYNTRLLMDEQYILDFFKQYPCLLRIICNEIRKSKKGILELLERFNKDREEIQQSIVRGHKLLKIKQVQLGLGDSHFDGRRTVGIQFENHQIIYKPRDSKPEFFYSTLIKKWNTVTESRNYHIKTPTGIYKKDYSWIEYIPFEECSHVTDVSNFYKRIGVQMAFVYALNAMDLHFENIIAYGSYPVFIDLECLFASPVSSNCEIEDAHYKAQKKVTTSLYSLGLLPTTTDSRKDISGIGSDLPNTLLVQIPQIVPDNNATIKVQTRNQEYTKVKKNQPRLNEKKVLVSSYIEDILDGFKKAYDYIYHHKEQILKEIQACNSLFRYIIKSTNKYASALDLSYHPQFVQHSMDREFFLLKACGDLNAKDSHEKFNKMEFFELLNGDIPYFKFNIHSRDLILPNGQRIKDFFSCTPYQNISEKIQGLCKNDLIFQMNLIKKAICIPMKKSKQHLPIHTHVTKFKRNDCLINKAAEIGDYLFHLAITGVKSKKRNFSWIHITNSSGLKKPLHVMNDTLYDGLAGIAIMFLLLWKCTNKEEYLRIAEDIMNDIINRFQLKQLNIPSQSIGGFSGIASILYVSINFYLYTQKKKYLNFSQNITNIILDMLPEDRHYDVINGTSGAILVLIRVYEITRNTVILNIVGKLGDFLINNTTHIDENEIGWKGENQTILTGFSHGNAGIMFVLQRLYLYIRNPIILKFIQKALIFENNNKLDNYWIDLRNPNKKNDALTWCHGSPGILLSRLELQHCAENFISKQAKKDISSSLFNLVQYGFINDISLCHGKIGNILILIQYARLIRDEKLMHASKYLLFEVVENINLNDQDGLGLMTGLAGTAYALLYAYNNTLPNILTLR